MIGTCPASHDAHQAAVEAGEAKQRTAVDAMPQT